MAFRQALQWLVVSLAGATLAGCVQHTGSERAGALNVSPQVSWQPERQAAVVTRRRVAAVKRKHAPLAARKPETRDAASGTASFYRHHQKTANGETFNPSELTAAHRTLPFGTRLRVTNVENGQTVTVRVNDRGPFIAGRVVDVSHSAAEALGMVGRGIAKVKLDVVE
jgi:peptidoglycan lytic transglycosylase